MRRLPVVAIALILVHLPLHGQQTRDERDLGGSGAMSLDQLRREPIDFQLDIPYANTANPRQRLDVYTPTERKVDILPVIVFFHGGGWMQGDKSDGARRLLPFVRSGQYVGVSVGYRLSGEAPWPAQIHDSKAAIRWIRGNAARFGFDPDRIGAWGRNAGAHLALLLGTTGDVATLEGTFGLHRNASSSVRGVANYFGVSEMLAIQGQPTDIDRTQPKAPEALLIGSPLAKTPDVARAASPVTYVTANDPPVLTVHGDADRVVPYDQAGRLDRALRRVGVPSYFITVRGAGHGDFPTAADDRVRMFFDRYLRGQNVLISTAAIRR